MKTANKKDNSLNELWEIIEDAISFFEKSEIKHHGLQFPEIHEKTEQNALIALRKLIDISKEWALVINEALSSMYIADGEGRTLMVNKRFIEAVNVSAEDVLGKYVDDLEKANMFRPSVLRLVREEKRKISLVQIRKGGGKSLVQGVPIFDENDNIKLMVSSAVILEWIAELYSYLHTHLMEAKQIKKVPYPSISFIGESYHIKEILNLVDQVKDTDSTILITGESGVGKSILAKHIHETSNRKNEPLIEINCGAIPESLIESELFGYESGAFTGAGSSGKAGIFELADKGTLMLDEISELPYFSQVKLLKVLQDKMILRIGGTKLKKVDVRIIAASNKNLADLVNENKFRADLFFRLNVIPIHITPLRERKEDIIIVADHLIEKYKNKYNKSVSCTSHFFSQLLKRNWPGNIRELENYIERKIVTNVSGVIDKDDQFEDTGAMLANGNSTQPLNIFTDQTEEQVIKNAYEKYKSSYKVANALGISQSSAHRKIKKYCKSEVE